jgi:hypothetical protein
MVPHFSGFSGFIKLCVLFRTPPEPKEKNMKKLPLLILSVVLLCAGTAVAQNSNSSTTSNTATANANKPKRGPVFRATADQIKQAQALLKQRNFYSGVETGKLSPETRAGLKLYQAAEGLKATGTLNKVTLVKMGITLTDKQKAM